MVVTQPVTSLARKAPKSPAGLRTKRLSVSPLAIPAAAQQRSECVFEHISNGQVFILKLTENICRFFNADRSTDWNRIGSLCIGCQFDGGAVVRLQFHR